MRERVRRVHRQRRDQRKDVLQIILANLGTLGAGQIAVSQDMDFVLGQFGHDLPIGRLLDFLDRGDFGQTFVDLLLGGPAVHRRTMHTGADLLFQTADTFHDEFVQRHIGDSQKLDPFQQRRTRIAGFIQNPAVEG